ncbi:MAG: hypothetical protein IJE95_01915 [Methanocorpusculum sp.]|nr:hypothetical protein [Methanocorpusculum sp.]
MTANVCRALLTVFLALCLLSGATASDEFSDALMQDTCVECGSADGHLESCSLYVIPDIIDDSFDTDIPDIVEEPLNPEFSGDDLSSSDAVSSGDDPSSSDLLTGSTEPPVQLSFAEQLLASDDLWGMYSKILSAMNEDVGILYALTADELAVLKEHANLLYLSIPEPTYDDTMNRDDIIATLTVLEEELAGTYEPVSVYADEKPLTDGTYIYFDLSAGDVTIDGNYYSGSYYDSSNRRVTISGDYSPSNKYYVYQSNTNTNHKPTISAENTLISVPQYERVQSPTGSGSWGDYITNNTDVEGIISNWKTEAGEVGRESTSNWISVTGSGTYNITIDNLWSSKQTDAESRSDGGIAFNPGSSGKLTVNLVGDNRFGNIHYYAKKDLGAQIIFNSDAGDLGTLTVANIESGKGTNHWNSVIGADDGGGDSVGIVIKSGIIYAGATLADVCTAIGAGGNGYGHVTINGGTVTAVTASSGTALGGGIAETSYGGIGYVEITGGIVYAYNLGYVSTYSSPAQFIPAAAIGGGSSCNQYGSKGTVLISGGTVYAQSIGGTAIGGGSSTKNKGGDADITITGGGTVVTACSIGGTVFDMSGGNQKTVQPGAAIGGGTGGNGAGGKAILTISGGQIFTGSIGGGKGKTSTGSAAVNITGGTIIGQVMMEGDGSSFEMTDGVIDNTNSADYNFQKTDGGAVWIQTGTATMEGGTIKNAHAENGGAIYVSGGSFAMSGGNISSTSATANGGAIYVSGGTVSISGGNITDVSAEEGGGAVYVAVTDVSDGDSFTMSGGTIQNATATEGSGGAVAVANGKASMKGGSIKESTASADGGAVSVSGGSFAMSGGTIGADDSECKAQYGGAVSVTGGTFLMNSTSKIIGGNATVNGGAVYVNITDYSDGNSFTMSEYAEILKSKASVNGGAVCVEGGNALMSGGTIGGISSNGCSAERGGGVSVTGGTFTMSGSKIQNCTAVTDGGGVYVYVDGDTTKDSFTMSASASIENCTVSSGNGGAVSVSGGSASMSGSSVIKSSHAYSTNNDVTVGNGGGVSVTGGTFTMSSSKILNCTAVTGGGAVYVNITVSSEEDSFTMSASASIENCTVSSGNGGAVSVSGGSASMIGNSVIKNSHAENGYGGAVSISNGGFIMSGGTIGAYDSECKAQYGGAVSVTGGTFLMNSTSKIIGGNATVNGGGVYVKVTSSDGDSFTMSDSTAILNSKASGNGGAVCVEGGSASMLSGTINSSTASDNGGAVSVSGGSFTMSGGTIGAQDAGCSAANGGAVSVTGGTFTMSNSRIQNCTATSNGGAVYVQAAGGSDGYSFTIANGFIESCKGVDGGAIYVSSGSAKMESGSLLYCNATNNGGGVYVSGGNFNMTTGYLQYCNATNYGGAAYLTGGNFDMDSGTLSHSHAKYGGAVYMTGGNFDMYSGAVIYNVADNNGGAVFVNNGNIVVGKDGCKGKDTTHSHPDTKYNRAGVYGGALAVSDGTVTLYCGNITDNTAEESSDSNTIHQTGGTITVHGGTIGTGVAVIGGNSQYIDKRGNVRTIYFYTATLAQSEIVEIIKVHHPSVTASNLILNESKIESAWTTTQNKPQDKFVIGWTNDEGWKVGESYWPEGSEVPLTQDASTEVHYYAIWGNAEPNPHCIVIIPETLTINENGKGSAGIGVDTFEHIPNIGSVTVSLSNFDGKLSLQGYDSIDFDYKLSAGEIPLSSSNLKVTDFTYSSHADVTLTAEASTDSARFSGEYSDELTFEISYSVRAYNPDSY